MNAPHLIRGPEGHSGKGVELEGAEGDLECLSNGKGIEMDGRQSRVDSTRSSTGSSLKRVNMRLLAGNKGDQHKWHKHEMAHIPEPSRSPSKPTMSLWMNQNEI